MPAVQPPIAPGGACQCALDVAVEVCGVRVLEAVVGTEADVGTAAGACFAGFMLGLNAFAGVFLGAGLAEWVDSSSTVCRRAGIL